MTNFLCVPQEDHEFDGFAYSMGNNAMFKTVALKRTDGGPTGLQKYGKWGDINAGDTLYICGHGHPKSTHKIGWVANGKQIVWGHDQLAAYLGYNIPEANKRRNVRYELLMCWGADSILWKDPFGSRLATDLGKRGFSGTVIGYTGSIIIGGGGKSLFIQGSGRFSSNIGKTMTGPQSMRALKPTKKDSRHVNVFNHFECSKKRKTWNIP